MLGRHMGQGLLVLGLLLGLSACNAKTGDEFKTQDQDKTVKSAETHHHYHDPGPHGGVLADLGTDHTKVAELVYSAEPRSITVYVVDHHDFKKPVALEAKSMTLELEGESSPLTLSAEPQEGDEEGKASKFVVTGDAIPASIKDQAEIHGHVHVEVGGKTLEAEFHDEEHHDEDEKE